ncbi:S-layer homology domain-containing protein [Paenibacillus tuaregi]|uniref:S-layer homology domain-containing protein n=1 Tax=Paenibacillus tuaregi TaxID=1816681 RepID=UPI000B08C911|nr:S-layer homology domain-containing protein [Paenibacillus tuaregi]
MLRRVSIIFLFVITGLAAGVKSAEAYDFNVQSSNASKTKEAIVEQWLKYRPMESGGYYMDAKKIYVQAPNVEAPYAAGSIKKEYIEDGVGAVNFVRYLAGLPNDIEPDWSLQEQEQTGAMINAVNNRMSHSPSKPEGMSEGMYKLGVKGTGSSNLFWGSPTFYKNVLGYMSDSDSSNIDRVGHRRWILNPRMKKTMFGMVYSKQGTPHSAMYAFNKDRSQNEVQYDYVSWPSAGYFPKEVFASRDAWSVSLNDEKYDNERTDQIAVELTRTRDGKQWTFDKKDTNKDGKYFNVQTSNYGIPFAVIFRPDGIYGFNNDEKFDVRITGLYKVNGESAEIHFSTTFFTLESTLAPRNSIKMFVGDKLKLRLTNGAQSIKNICTSSDASKVRIDESGNVQALAEGTATISINSYFEDAGSLTIHVVKPDSSEKVSKWAYPDYMKAKSNGLVVEWHDHDYQGFVTRADFTTMAVLALETITERTLVNFDDADTKSPFKDYEDSTVAWASHHDIIKGTSENLFSPYQTLTREEAAVLLMNMYNKAVEINGSESEGAVASKAQEAFSDDSQISAWAKNKVYQAVNLSLLNGTGKNRFEPQGKLTYEQTYIMLEKLYERIKE